MIRVVLLDGVSRQVIEQVSSLVAEDAVGQFGLLSGCEPFTTMAEPGLFRYRASPEGAWRFGASAGGLFQCGRSEGVTEDCSARAPRCGSTVWRAACSSASDWCCY